LFLESILKDIEAVKVMNLSKSLIFVIGNLDEAFYMSSNINPDIDADEFHKNTLKINIADIKTALQSRFRNEQIARLGNNHLVYHAFTHKHYQEFIELHLGHTNMLMLDNFNISIDFDKSVKDMIYKEGVFPTQGVRPVMSTIRNLIESNFSKIMLAIAENDFTNAHRITWSYKKEKFYIGIFDVKGRQIHKLVLHVMLKINSLRESLDDDLQALIGIHESGHTIACIMFTQLVPEYVISRTVDSESNGFTFIQLPQDIATFKFILDQMRIGLGGYVAERLIFSAENNTSGTSRDIESVTQLAHQAIRDFGMNNDPIKLHIHDYGGSPYKSTVLPIHEQKAQQLVLECLKNVETCLQLHKPLLVEMGRYLSKNSRINKPELKKMVTEYCLKHDLDAPKYIEADQYYNFKELLKECDIC
jgi:cell division protease FtsH